MQRILGLNKFENLVYSIVSKDVTIHRTLDWIVNTINFDNDKSGKDVVTTKEVEKCLEKLIDGGLVSVHIANSSTYKHFSPAQDLTLVKTGVKSVIIKWNYY